MESLLLVPCILTVNTVAAAGLVSQFNAYNALNSKKKYELLSRITGCMFQLYVCYRGFYINQDAHTFLHEVAGYMIYEMVHMLFYSDSLPMYFHHVVYLYFYATRFSYSHEIVIHFATYIWMLESTAPLLSVCWTLHLFNYPDTPVHKGLKLLGFLYWSVIRIGVFPYILYTTEPANVYLGGSVIVALNLYWFTLLLKRVAGAGAGAAAAPAPALKNETRLIQ